MTNPEADMTDTVGKAGEAAKTNDIARKCLRPVRGALTDDQYIDCLRRVEDAIETAALPLTLDREAIARAHDEALEAAAQLVISWKADPAIAFSIRELKSAILSLSPAAKARAGDGKTSERAKAAYDALRGGLPHDALPAALVPGWGEGPAWVRDLATVAYLQGKLDMPIASPPPQAGWPALVEFTRWCIEESFDGFDVDGASIQSKLTKLGVLKETVYDPAVHGSKTNNDAQPGDTWYETAAWLSASPAPPLPGGEVVASDKPHKVMTAEEYLASNIQGWHSVCWRYDNAGGVAIRYGASLPSQATAGQTAEAAADKVADFTITVWNKTFTLNRLVACGLANRQGVDHTSAWHGEEARKAIVAAVKAALALPAPPSVPEPRQVHEGD